MNKATLSILREIKEEQYFDDLCEASFLLHNWDNAKESEARFFCFYYSIAAQALLYRFGYEDGIIHTYDEMMKVAEKIAERHKSAESEDLNSFDFDFFEEY